ncbi:MAG: membrane dipeptidase [Proteobacteria bacterium]|nr:membrane dipeptidase [Pseudomonadota bacterium]
MAATAALAAVSPQALADDSDAGVSAAARALYKRSMVFDANMFPPLDGEPPFPQSQLDMMRNSGVTAMKSSLGGFNNGLEDTVAEIAGYQYVIEKYPDYFLQIRTHADFARAKRENKTGILFSFETVTPLDGKPERIEMFRGLGVRVMQITYNVETPFGMGCLGDPNSGLTDLGRKAIEAMNKQGVVLDLSHSNVKTSLEALKATKKTAIITHAGCEAVHKHPRNKPDSLLKAVADQGGVVGIYDLCYLTASPKQPTLNDYMDHMTHALKVCGEDHVGIGSDSSLTPWDTSPDAMAAFNKDEEARHKAGVAAPEEDRPLYVEGLNTPMRSEIIADALLKRGYSERVAEKVLGLNFANAFKNSWGDA